MQQLPVLSAASLAPARPGQGTAAGWREAEPHPEVVDLRRSRRLARPADPTVRERWDRASPAAGRPEGRVGGTASGPQGTSVAPAASRTIAPRFAAQLIGQLPAVQAGAAARGHALTAALASNAYRQAGAEPAPTNPTARTLDIAI